MSAAEAECAAEPPLCSFPEFALASRVDDPDDPGELTVYPAGADAASLVTRWLTVDADAAVPLADAR